MTNKPIEMEFYDDAGSVALATIDDLQLTVRFSPGGVLRCVRGDAAVLIRLHDFLNNAASVAIRCEAVRAARAAGQKVVESDSKPSVGLCHADSAQPSPPRQ